MKAVILARVSVTRRGARVCALAFHGRQLRGAVPLSPTYLPSLKSPV